MLTTIDQSMFDTLTGRLSTALEADARRYPGDSHNRQPVHTVYGGAQLFNADTPAKLGRLAARAFGEYAAEPTVLTSVLGIDPDLAGVVHQRVREKLAREPIEDLRVDFEDGYGIRADDVEDADAVKAAAEMAKALDAGTLPPFIGIRVKALSSEAKRRSIRTLDLFLTALVEAAGRLPDNFLITLPKVVLAEQVAALADAFDLLEQKLGIAAGTLKMEIMIESTRSIITADGRWAMPIFLEAARGRMSGAHFGAYDYTASCGITSANQDMLHQACDYARNVMQTAYGGTGVFLSDGATNIMPVGPHRGEDLSAGQLAENRTVVQRAWRLHYDHVRHSLAGGFYQGWDLHPAQIPTRYAAIFAFFMENMETAAVRLRNFIAAAARATLVGDQFDDAATGQGLLLFFVRAVNCGAVSEDYAARLTGLTITQLRSASFADLIAKP
ncbi:MAG: phosphoenolpyruvate kinase [Chloracidobacterium sp.]|nr:phosphoenolpyruvate kinase [Chloracidobacterium sp.]MBK9439155.1 phosphoenolpyruvate kinase [Chloracidobacterium sp.]